MGKEKYPPKIGWPCVIEKSSGAILGICTAINSKVKYGTDSAVVEEVTVWQLAQKLSGDVFFEPLEHKHQGEIVAEADEITRIYLAGGTPE